MHRLLLVSNRLPVTVALAHDEVTVEPAAGGLATGLRQPHERSGGLWIGWPGPLEVDTADTRAALGAQLDALKLEAVYLTSREVHRYYEGFANSVIWPLFHYLTGQVPLRVEGWDEYYAVNDRFAAAAAERYQPGDLIWVHDYHLMLVPALLRKRLPDARIGFFLHIPFPGVDLFSTLPYREELLQGLLGADVIGFHTASYRRHFVDALERLVDLSVAGDRVEYGGRQVSVRVFPMGVDAAQIAERAAQSDVAELTSELKVSPSGQMLLGIDRLDYTKGIPRRLLAFEELLKRHPEWQGNVRLLQVAVPSRTGVRSYRNFRDEVDALVGRINGNFGTPGWVPVHYLYRSVPEAQLLALYCTADVMLVTPVRDGMNLVAKEFAAARNDEDGVLVLSEFAGAADELTSALFVNPYDLEDSADAYHHALTMSRAERRERMRALRATVFEHDVHSWVASFLNALTPAAAKSAAPTDPAARALPDPSSLSFPPNALELWPAIQQRLQARPPALFLDYDGTLTPIVQNPKDAVLSREVRECVERLGATMPVILISGRGREDLMQRVGLQSIYYAGSHGFDISGPDGLRHQVAEEFIPLIKNAADGMHELTGHIGGVVIEEKLFTVAVHYRMVAHSEVPEIAAAVDRLLADQTRLVKRFGKKVIEIRPAVDWDKGHAVRWILEALAEPGPWLPVYLGDDLTDEDAFAAIDEPGITIRIGETAFPTCARWSLRDSHEVKAFLDRISESLDRPDRRSRKDREEAGTQR